MNTFEGNTEFVLLDLNRSKHMEGRDIKLVCFNGKTFLMKSSTQSLEKEFESMKEFDSRFIGKVYKLINERSYLMEFYPGGNIECERPMDIARIKRYFFQMASALQVVHSNNFAHLDVRINNFVLDLEDCVKLIDFEHSTRIDVDAVQGVRGCNRYNAPERYKGRYCGFKADIFSLGVVLFRLLTGEYPFPIANNSSSRFKIFIQNSEKFWDRMFVHLCKVYGDIELNEEAIDLINWMLSEDPQDRPSIDEVLKHSFLLLE